MGQRISLVAVGRAGELMGLRPNLRPDNLIATARKLAATGHDFERNDWREPLELLCRSLEDEADLTFLGRFLARTDICRRLSNRLLIEESVREHPDMLERPVSAPVFILGLPRTGTTLLHRMLAEDQGNRVLLGWETDRPAPPPESATYDTDPRIRQTEGDFRGINWVNPRFRHIHEVGARLPEEDLSWSLVRTWELDSRLDHPRRDRICACRKLGH